MDIVFNNEDNAEYNQRIEIHPNSFLYAFNAFHGVAFILWIYFLLKHIFQRDYYKLVIPVFWMFTFFLFINTYRSLAPIQSLHKLCFNFSGIIPKDIYNSILGWNNEHRDHVLSNLSSICFASVFLSTFYIIGLRLRSLFGCTEWKCFMHLLFASLLVVVSIEILDWFPLQSYPSYTENMIALKNGMYGILSLCGLFVLILLSGYTDTFITLLLSANQYCKMESIYKHVHSLLYFKLFPFLLLTCFMVVYFIVWELGGQYIYQYYYKQDKEHTIEADNMNVVEILLRRFAYAWKRWHIYKTKIPVVCLSTISMNFMGIFIYSIFDNYSSNRVK